tara:strand:- start:614 stop:718 length:105 start_codon:yes stop_codon:yes gene_type:complete
MKAWEAARKAVITTDRMLAVMKKLGSACCMHGEA